jgi:proline iminopeptidase
VAHESGGVPNPRHADARFRVGFARTVTHYFRHAAWLREGRLLEEAHLLSGIPGVLIHGQLDLGGPFQSASELAQSWPGSELIVVPGAGHTSEGIRHHVVAATDRFARAAMKPAPR